MSDAISSGVKMQSKAAANAGKFLTFGLGNEEFGLEILKVREINGMMEITRVPAMPDYVLGVINLRGKVIPVVDLRLMFGMSAHEQTSETCIIVVDVNSNLRGVVVDHVSEVMDFHAEEIEDAPEVGQGTTNDSILGMAKTKGRVRILLDINRVLENSAIH